MNVLIHWVVATLLSLFTNGRGPLEHVVAPPGLTLSADSCAGCHAGTVEEWRGSRHARAWSNNRIFAASFRRDPERWCVSCHAPVFQGTAPPAHDEGVNCAACHLRDGEVLTARAPSAAAQAAHPMRQAGLDESDFCGGCHQFAFPTRTAPTVVYSDLPMQNTLVEWRASGTSVTCQGCHMPRGAHRFPGGHDVDLVRSAIAAKVQVRDGAVVATLRSQSGGHHIPTGDPFRQLRLTIATADSETTSVFARHLALDNHVVSDTSLPPGGAVTRTVLDVAPPGPLTWRLTLRYPALSTLDDLHGDDVEIEVARGVVAR